VSTETAPTTDRPVDFWFDPTCPWAWMTSRWVDEVSAVRNLEVRWHIMSLAVLNEDREVSEEHRAAHQRGLRYGRLVAAAAERHGPSVVKPLYDALGFRIHLGGRTDADAVMAESLTDVGLPDDLLPFADTEEYEPQLRASHADGIERVGQDVGTPVIAVGDVAFFGPVLSPTPRGEQAVALWDGVLALSSFDGFFELKRSRTRGPDFS
jgi:2-hydroxychromene-2-carboxylate isomerase